MRVISKIFLTILSVIVILSVASITVSALGTTGKCGDNVTWYYDEEKKTITISGTGAMYDYGWDSLVTNFYNAERVIVSEGVTSIGAFAFSYCKNLLYAEISGSVKSIGQSAFLHCSQLTTVIIGEGVETIGTDAFNGCGLLIMEIPDSVKIIGDYSFKSCYQLANVTFGDGVEKIGDNAFDNCQSLTTVSIPENVREIGVAFRDCSNLEYISVDENNKYYSNDEYGVLFNKDMTTIIAYPAASPMTAYVIPDGVTTIGSRAFVQSTNLSSVTISEGVKKISNAAFYMCSKLSNIEIPDSVTEIGGSAFWGTALKKVEFPKELTKIGARAFKDCKVLKEVVIPANVTEIQRGAFEGAYKISVVCFLGSQEQWNDITIVKDDNGPLLRAKIHFNCRKTDVLPTCTAHGCIQYACDCCGVYNNEYYANPTGHTLNEDGVCEVCGEKEVSVNHINTQKLTIESVFAMIMNLILKLLGIFSVA